MEMELHGMEFLKGTTDTPFPSEIVVQDAATGEFDLDVTIDKSIFNNVPAGAQSLIGVYCDLEELWSNRFRL